MMELTTSGLETMLDAVRSAESISKAVALVRQIDALKTALESVDRFHEESIKYAMLEAEALIRVVELGGASKLKTSRRKTAEWLFKLEAADRQKFIWMCGDGMTIDQIFNREVLTPQKTDEALRNIKECENFIYEALKDTGVADLAYFSREVKRELRGIYNINANDIIDGARNRLLLLGAVGIGNNSGVYVMPDKASKDEICYAIYTRYVSIAADIASVKALALSCSDKISFGDIEAVSTQYSWAKPNDSFYDPALKTFMESIGVISDGGGRDAELHQRPQEAG